MISLAPPSKPLCCHPWEGAAVLSSSLSVVQLVHAQLRTQSGPVTSDVFCYSMVTWARYLTRVCTAPQPLYMRRSPAAVTHPLPSRARQSTQIRPKPSSYHALAPSPVVVTNSPQAQQLSRTRPELLRRSILTTVNNIVLLTGGSN